jgi:D-threo-aldose 1-dehydrogenase
MVPAPFGGNILATGVRPERQPLYMYRPAIPEVVEAVNRMEERCRELGVSLPVAALAFVLTEPLVDLTVVGLARPEEVYWNVPACAAGVSRADLEAIREAGRIDPALIGGPDFKPVFAAAQRQV